MKDLYADMLSYLKTQPASKAAQDLRERIEARMPKPERVYVCRIKFDQDDIEKRFPYFTRFLHDGHICAGCGGFNHYGGYAGMLCWGCEAIDREHDEST